MLFTSKFCAETHNGAEHKASKRNVLNWFIKQNLFAVIPAKVQIYGEVNSSGQKKSTNYCICYRILVTLQPLSVQSLAGCRVPCYVAPGRQTI